MIDDELCPRCGEPCEEKTSGPHSSHAHFVGASIYQHEWTTLDMEIALTELSEVLQR